MNPKQLEKVIEEVKAFESKKDKDIVDILRDAGFGVVEGKDAVLAKIDEIGKSDGRPILDRP